MKMSVKDFDSLSKRDFDNGAVRDAIRNTLQESQRREEMIGLLSELLRILKEIRYNTDRLRA